MITRVKDWLGVEYTLAQTPAYVVLDFVTGELIQIRSSTFGPNHNYRYETSVEQEAIDNCDIERHIVLCFPCYRWVKVAQ